MSTSETVQAAQRLLAERERVGLAKYGTTVDRTDLQAGDWLQHAIEEASDLLLYLIRLQQTMGGRTPDSEIATLSGLAGAAPDAMTLEEQAASDRAAYLARWANAPAEATHLAQDTGGLCNWFEREPICDYDGQFERWSEGGRGWGAPTNALGRVACEPRPLAEGER